MPNGSPYREVAIARTANPDGVTVHESAESTLTIDVRPYTRRLVALWALASLGALAAVFGTATFLSHGAVDLYWVALYPAAMSIATFARRKTRYRIELRADGRVVSPRVTKTAHGFVLRLVGRSRVSPQYAPFVIDRAGKRHRLTQGMRRDQAAFVVDRLLDHLDALAPRR